MNLSTWRDNNRPVLTEPLARAAATDAANRRMRRAGRTAWTKGDLYEANRVFNRLWPLK